MHKEIEVVCPECSQVIVVDVRTGKVMRSARPHEIDHTGKVVLDESRWDEVSKRITDREGRGTDVFDSALDKEKNRSKDLDSLFDQARKKALEGEEGEDGT